ncbi:MAG: hypothetical protein Q9193_005413 [Seirophora villosa]
MSDFLPSSSSSSVNPSYGGGRFYGGGATSAYSAGRRSPLGLLPLGLGLAAAALIFPGIWLYSVYNYPYTNSYRFRNGTRNRTTIERRQDQGEVTLPITCLCQEFNACGCDDNPDTSYLDPIIGDGTNLNSSLVHIGDVDGTRTIVLNGTLPNGTDASETSSATSLGSGGLINQRILEVSECNDENVAITVQADMVVDLVTRPRVDSSLKGASGSWKASVLLLGNELCTHGEESIGEDDG